MNNILLHKLFEKPISGEWGKDGGSTKVIRTTNFTNEGRLNLSDVVERDISIDKVNKKRLKPGDIIIEKSGGSPTQPVGRVVHFDGDGEFLCNNFTSILRPKKDLCCSKYVLYQMFAAHLFGFTSRYQNKTTGIINLKLDNYLKDYKIPLPPLETQRKIAAILDTADAYRQKTKALIEKYDALAQSLFLDMFGDPVTNPKGWEYKELKELVSKLGDGIHGTPEYSDDGEFHFINGNNLIRGQIVVTDSTKKVSRDEYEKHAKELNENTMLVSINGTIGKVAFYRGEKVMLGKSACYFNLIPQAIEPQFLYHVIDSPYFIRYATKAATGSTIKNVSLKSMRAFPIPCPPNALQNEFVRRIEKLNTQRLQAELQIIRSEELFNSLLQKAFRGELV